MKNKILRVWKLKIKRNLHLKTNGLKTKRINEAKARLQVYELDSDEKISELLHLMTPPRPPMLSHSVMEMKADASYKLAILAQQESTIIHRICNSITKESHRRLHIGMENIGRKIWKLICGC